MDAWLQILLAVAGGITAIGVIWRSFLRPLWRSIRHGEEMWENVKTIAPFQEEVRAFMVEMRTHRDFVDHELSDNHGGSVKDMARDGRDEAIAAKGEAIAAKQLIEQHMHNPELHRPVQVNVNNTNDN